MTAINKLISVAEAEVGYLEKKSKSMLDDKTANAGSANYTKYWRDIKPSYQGQPWCACFVTWCFVQAFGSGTAARLLKHYPYVYCPTMASLFRLNAKPKRGDIVIFCRGGTFAHTGIVTSVDGDYFTTIEGNTSGASGIIANGGGVCKKGYYKSNLPGTQFVTVDWSIVKDEEEIDMEELNTLKAELAAYKVKNDDLINKMGKEIAELKPVIYDYIDENMPEWAKPTIQKLVSKGAIKGDNEGKLGLTYDLMRMLVVLDRVGFLG